MPSDANETAPQQQKRVVGKPFLPGQSGNPAGRPKGARARLAEDFCQALLDDFAKGGAAAIMAMRDEKPGEYVRAIASVIPKEFEGTITASIGGMLDELDP